MILMNMEMPFNNKTQLFIYKIKYIFSTYFRLVYGPISPIIDAATAHVYIAASSPDNQQFVTLWGTLLSVYRT